MVQAKLVLFAVTWLVVLSARLCEGQSSLSCPLYSLVNVSMTNQNVLLFSELPTDRPNPDVSYSAGALAPWYDIAAGIIDTVRPGSVTEDVIVPLLGTNNLTSFGDNLPPFQTIAQDIASWWAGIIALTVLGGLLSFSFCVCCCCFGACRLCGKCGGNLKQEETNSMNCLTIVFTIILIVFVCGLIAGIVLSFFSNQRIFDSVTEFEETTENTFTLAENFVNDSVSKVDTLLCQLNDTLDVTVDQARELLTRVDVVINNFTGSVYDIVDTTISLSTALEAVQMSLTTISTSVVALQSNASNLNDTLQNIGQLVADLSSQCTSMFMGVTPPECNSLNPSVFQNGLQTDFQQLPNITGQLQNVQDLLSGIDLTNLAQQGNTTFNDALDDIRNLTRNADDEILSAVDVLRNTVFNASNMFRNITDNITGSSGYIETARDFVTNGFNTVREYDTPRYAFGVIISCSSVAVVVVVFLGLICGLCGFRTDRAPYERTALSNCGGMTLLCAAMLGFLFGFLMMLLAALVFFSGGVLQKFCSDVEGPQYILLNNTVDNPRINGGQYILSQNLLQNGSIRLAASDILRQCGDRNTTVYEALKINQSSYYGLIQDFTNISQFVPDVSGDVTNLAQDISNLISTDTFVPQNVRDTLNGFNTTGVAGIDINEFTSELNSAILRFNISEQISQLMSLQSTLNDANQSSLVNQTQSIINQLEDLQTDVSLVRQQGNALESQVNQLDNNTRMLLDGVDGLLRDINITFENLVNYGVNPLVQDVEAVIPRATGYAQQLVDHARLALENDVGNCFPLYAAYTGFYNAVCEFTLDGLNGFWLALGLCGILLIPIIIFSIVTSQYYRRMKYDEDLGVLPYEDSFPLKTY